MINDLASYSRQDAARGTVNEKQQKKIRKVYDLARKFQTKDKKRANKTKAKFKKCTGKTISY